MRASLSTSGYTRESAGKSEMYPDLELSPVNWPAHVREDFDRILRPLIESGALEHWNIEYTHDWRANSYVVSAWSGNREFLNYEWRG